MAARSGRLLAAAMATRGWTAPAGAGSITLATTSLRALAGEVESLEAELFARTMAAEAGRDAEVHAAVTIQAAWRGFVTRRNLAALHAAALVIQRHFRGNLGRIRFTAAWEARERARRRAAFDAAATRIQTAWRGYWSRATVHSYYAQRRYIEAVVARGEALRREAQAAYERQCDSAEIEAAEAAHARFLHSMKSMHHMLSTESRAGIYNSPFAAVSGGRPSVGGKAVEDCIRDTSLLLDAQNGVTRRQARAPEDVTAGGGDREVPGAPSEAFDSLLASMTSMKKPPPSRKKSCTKPPKQFYTSVHAPPLFADTPLHK